MKIKNKRNNVWLVLAIVFGIISIAINLLLVIMINTNLFGFQDYIVGLLYGNYPSIDVSGQIMSESFSLVLIALINLVYTVTYIRVLKYGTNSLICSSILIRKGVWQIIIASPIAGVFALIAGIKIKNSQPILQRVDVVPEKSATEEPVTDGLSQSKLTAMTEAVERLKQLKDSGAISEEEYYANLSRILEG